VVQNCRMTTSQPRGFSPCPCLAWALRNPVALSLLVLSFSTVDAAAAEPLVVDDTLESRPLGLYMDVLEDSSGAWTISDVASPDFARRFKACGRERNNFGYTESAYWFRLRVQTAPPRRLQFFHVSEDGCALTDRHCA
jgi:hypothetical protein